MKRLPGEGIIALGPRRNHTGLVKPNGGAQPTIDTSTGGRISEPVADTASEHPTPPCNPQQQSLEGVEGFHVQGMGSLEPQGNHTGSLTLSDDQRQMQGMYPVACSNPYPESIHYTAVLNSYLPSVNNPYPNSVSYIYQQQPQEQELQHVQNLAHNQFSPPYPAQIPVLHPSGQYYPHQTPIREASQP